MWSRVTEAAASLLAPEKLCAAASLNPSLDSKKSVLVIRRVLPLTLWLLAFLLWLLNHPYHGIWHDARVYGLISAHWIYPDALASDLFFRFGSQGSLSLFTPIYGELVRALGLDMAARLVTLTGGALWVAALFFLARNMLGNTLPGRFAVLFGVMISVSYSPNASIFVLNENFATARSWAMPCGLLAVALLAAGRVWWAGALALLSCLLHPLLGIWSLALVIITRMPMRWIVPLVSIPTLALIAIGMVNPDIPHLQLMRGEWLDYLYGASDILFKPLGENRLPVYFTALAGLLAGVRAGNPRWQALYARLLALACGGLMLALITAYWLPLEIVVQGQPWRVFWLAIPIAAVALLDVLQRALVFSRNGALLTGLLFVLVTLDAALLQPLVWLICGASFVSRQHLALLAEKVCEWRKILWVMLIALWLLALPGLIVELEIAGARFIGSWWHGAVALHGLVAGAVWFLPLLLAFCLGKFPQRRGAALPVTMLVIALVAITIAHWDWRSDAQRIEEARWLNPQAAPHPFARFIRPGDTIAWPEKETTVWFVLHTANYIGEIQHIGVVFSREKFNEWQRRNALLKQVEQRPEKRLALCPDPVVDWVVMPQPVAGVATVAVLPGAVLYACAPLRAVSPAPIF
ncbi:MAG: hypothetical protein IV084_04915 [Rugosibacter sp.]|nr:hypothetical protein [Rugosibacter sp.]